MNKIVGFVLLILVFVTELQGQAESPNPIQTGSPLLLILSDARSAGQGDVGVATSTDANSGYHNASKMAFSTSEYSVGVNYTPWLQTLVDGLFVGGGSIINRIDERSSWGADIRFFSLGDIDLYDSSGNDTGSANPYEFSASGSYALKLSNYFSMGVSLRYIRSDFKITGTNQNLNDINGFGVDVSGFYHSPERNYGDFNGRIRAGFNISNMGPKVSYSEGTDDFLPTKARIGGGFDFILDDYNTLALTLEFSKLLVPTPPIRNSQGVITSGKDDNVGWVEGMFQSLYDAPGGFGEELQEVNIGFGAEYLYTDSFALRGGYYYENEMKGNRKYFTMGAGLKAAAMNIDLSYLINASSSYNPLESTLRFSLSFDLGDIYDNF